MRESAGSRFQFSFLLLASWVVILSYFFLPPEPLFLCVQKEDSNWSNPLGFGEHETHSALKELHIVPGTENAYFLTPAPDPTSVATQMAKCCLNLDPAETPKTKGMDSFLRTPPRCWWHSSMRGESRLLCIVSGFQTPTQHWCLSGVIHKGKACLHTQCLNRACLETA